MSYALRPNLRAAALAAACMALLCGCATIHRWTHREPSLGCHEPPFKGNSDARPPLKVPEGLSAPDTTGAIKIPALSGAEAPRAKNDPCLDIPPNYGTEPAGPPTPKIPPR